MFSLWNFRENFSYVFYIIVEISCSHFQPLSNKPPVFSDESTAVMYTNINEPWILACKVKK